MNPTATMDRMMTTTQVPPISDPGLSTGAAHHPSYACNIFQLAKVLWSEKENLLQDSLPFYSSFFVQ